MWHTGIRALTLAVILAVALHACSSGGGGGGGSPSPVSPPASYYYVGFTPFPYDLDSIDTVLDYVYGRIAADANIILHHFDDGIQWDRALTDEAFHANILTDWQVRKDRTPAGHRIYVAVTPMNISRNGLAPYRSDTANQPLPPPWDTYAFNHPSVKTAYLNYCRRVIDFFSPDYFAMGIEVNLLMINAKPSWPAFVELHQYVYGQLKTQYPALPIFVSFTGLDLVSGWTSANHADQVTALSDIIGYSDYFGLSLHPQGSEFMLNKNPATVPSVADFRTVFSLSSKPIAVCETSWPAEPFTAYGGLVSVNGTPEQQALFFQNMFAAADQYNTKFIINFILRDYDALWQDLGSPDDLTRFWRDTGFYDENGNGRPVLAVWRGRL